MGDGEEEYEVETIQSAKVEQDKRGRKSWKYYVKWKGYDQDGNTWEPYTSFVGSEHFVESFWARVRSERDHTLMRLFKPGEEMFPVGPPGKIKSTKKSGPPPSKEEPRTSPRRPARRKQSESEVEVQLVEEDSEPAPARQSQRKRRASAIEQPEEASSTKRSRRSRVPVQVESDEEADEVVPVARTPSRRASTSRARAVNKQPEPSSSRLSRASTSPAKPSARGRSTAGNRRKEPIKLADEVIEIDSDSDEPAAPPGQPSSRPTSSIAYVEVPPSPAKANGSSKRSTTRIAKASAIPVEDVAAGGDELPMVKSRPTRKLKPSAPDSAIPSTSRNNGKLNHSPSRRHVAGGKAGPGRSSKGIVTGKTSGLTATPNGSLKTPRKPAPTPRAGKAKQRQPTVEDVDAMAIDDDPLLAPLTNDDLDHLAKLTGTPVPGPAADASDYEGTSEKDAEGESDHDFVGEHQSPKIRREKGLASPGNAETSSKNVQDKVQEQEPVPTPDTTKEAEVIEAPKQVVINPPDTAIGGSMERRNSFASWKPPTIFDNISTTSFRATTDVPASSAESSQPVLSIPISPSLKLSVKLQDIHPPTDPTRKRLDEVITQQQTGPPGKFYKGQAAEDMLKAFGCKGSSARVILSSDVDDAEKQNFDKLCSYLKEGNLFIAVVGTVILAFCSSNSTEFTTKLDISPNLVGLGDNTLVAEVVIADDAAYCDAVINAEDIRW